MLTEHRQIGLVDASRYRVVPSAYKETPRHDECAGRLPESVHGANRQQVNIRPAPHSPRQYLIRRLLGRTRMAVVNLWASGIILRRLVLWLFEGFPASLERSGNSGHQWGVGGSLPRSGLSLGY